MLQNIGCVCESSVTLHSLKLQGFACLEQSYFFPVFYEQPVLKNARWQGAQNHLPTNLRGLGFMPFELKKLSSYSLIRLKNKPNKREKQNE